MDTLPRISAYNTLVKGTLMDSSVPYVDNRTEVRSTLAITLSIPLQEIYEHLSGRIEWNSKRRECQTALSALTRAYSMM